MIAYFLIRQAGLGQVWSIIAAAIASSLTTILGAITAAFVVQDVEGLPLGFLLGGTSGALLYVIAFHLGPHARFARRPDGYVMAAAGVIVATMAEMIRHAAH